MRYIELLEELLSRRTPTGPTRQAVEQAKAQGRSLLEQIRRTAGWEGPVVKSREKREKVLPVTMATMMDFRRKLQQAIVRFDLAVKEKDKQGVKVFRFENSLYFQTGKCTMKFFIDTDGLLGWDRPSMANWARGGFFNVFVDGKEICKKSALEVKIVSSGSARGETELTWEDAAYRLTVRLIVLRGDGRLFLIANVQSKADKAVKIPFEVKLTCYPNTFADSSKAGAKTRQRVVLIGNRQVKMSQVAALGARDTRLFYMDDWYDRAKSHEHTQYNYGPCGVRIAPKGYLGGNVDVQHYAVYTTLRFSGKVSPAGFVFYDYPDVTNEQALQNFSADARDTLQKLKQFLK